METLRSEPENNHNGHYGTGVIITDPMRQLFYFQQKCEHYPIPEYRGKYCLFGGGIEKGEAACEALVRELHEELDVTPASHVMFSMRPLKRFDITARDQTYTFTLFESVLSTHLLRLIADSRRYPVSEGAGVLAERDDFSQKPFIWGLEKAVSYYLDLFVGDKQS